MGELIGPTVLVMTNQRDEMVLMYRAVLISGECLKIEGHDLGRGVEEFWGMSEYEFTRTYTAEQTLELATLLGCTRDELLTAINERFETTSDVEQFASEHGLEPDRWSRVGD